MFCLYLPLAAKRIQIHLPMMQATQQLMMLPPLPKRLKKPHLLPREFYIHIEKDGVERVVLDYISGMTDRYCIALFEDIFVPKVWR